VHTALTPPVSNKFQQDYCIELDYCGEGALGLNPTTSTLDIHRITPLMCYSDCEAGREGKMREEDFYHPKAHK